MSVSQVQIGVLPVELMSDLKAYTVQIVQEMENHKRWHSQNSISLSEDYPNWQAIDLTFQSADENLKKLAQLQELIPILKPPFQKNLEHVTTAITTLEKAAASLAAVDVEKLSIPLIKQVFQNQLGPAKEALNEGRLQLSETGKAFEQVLQKLSDIEGKTKLFSSHLHLAVEKGKTLTSKSLTQALSSVANDASTARENLEVVIKLSGEFSHHVAQSHVKLAQVDQIRDENLIASSLVTCRGNSLGAMCLEPDLKIEHYFGPIKEIFPGKETEDLEKLILFLNLHKATKRVLFLNRETWLSWITSIPYDLIYWIRTLGLQKPVERPEGIQVLAKFNELSSGFWGILRGASSQTVGTIQVHLQHCFFSCEFNLNQDHWIDRDQFLSFLSDLASELMIRRLGFKEGFDILTDLEKLTVKRELDNAPIFILNLADPYSLQAFTSLKNICHRGAAA